MIIPLGLSIVVFHLSMNASAAQHGILDDLPQIKIGMPLAEFQHIRPNIHLAHISLEDQTGAISSTETIPTKGKVLIAETLQNDPWFATALYAFADGQLNTLGLSGNANWPPKRILNSRTSLLMHLLSLMGPPRDKAVVRLDQPPLGHFDVPQITWQTNGDVLILLLPTKQHGRYAYLTYGLELVSTADIRRFIAGREPLNPHDRDAFFKSAGISIESTGTSK